MTMATCRHLLVVVIGLHLSATSSSSLLGDGRESFDAGQNGDADVSSYLEKPFIEVTDVLPQALTPAKLPLQNYEPPRADTFQLPDVIEGNTDLEIDEKDPASEADDNTDARMTRTRQSETVPDEGDDIRKRNPDSWTTRAPDVIQRPRHSRSKTLVQSDMGTVRDMVMRKRQFGHVLGKGYKIGKREKMEGNGPGMYVYEGKRQFGRVLNGGYKIGKREHKEANSPDMYMYDSKRQFGRVLGGGYKIGKREHGEANSPDMYMYDSKRQFGRVLNGGYKIGKREHREANSPDMYMYDSKRQFGRVLNGGYKIGKREHREANSPDMYMYDSKRQFGRVLGGGYKIGKRERLESYNPDMYVHNAKRQFGRVLNGGYKMGKREKLEANNPDMYMYNGKRQFGRVLGGGYKIGKRERLEPYSLDFVHKDKRQFGRVLGGGYKIGKRQKLPANRPDMFLYESKRQFGQVLGGGYKMGKRESRFGGRNSNEQETDEVQTSKRHSGSVLRGGYQTRKRDMAGSVHTYTDDLLERDVNKQQFGRMPGGGYNPDMNTQERKRSQHQFGQVLAGGYKIGKRERTGYDDLIRRSIWEPRTPSENRYSATLSGDMPFETPSVLDPLSIPLDHHDAESDEYRPSDLPRQWEQNSIPVGAFPGESPTELNHNSIPVGPFPGESPTELNQNSIPVGPFPGESPTELNHNSIPVGPFPGEYPTELNQNSVPSGRVPPYHSLEWSRNRLPVGHIPVDLSISNSVEVKQSLSFPRSNIAPWAAFSSNPGSLPPYLDEGQFGTVDHRSTSQIIDVTWLIDSLLKEAERLLKLLVTPSESDSVPPPFHHPDIMETTDPSRDAGQFRDIKRSSPVDPTLLFLRVQDWLEKQLHKHMSYSDEASSKNVALNHEPLPHSRSHLADEEVSHRHARKEGGAEDGSTAISKRQNLLQHHVESPSKRWFFNVKFPRGYKLGKRATDRNLETAELMGDPGFPQSSEPVDGESFHVIGSLADYVKRLKQTLGQQGTQAKHRFTWKNPYGYRKKREAQLRERTNLTTDHPCRMHSFMLADADEESTPLCKTPARLSASSYVFSLSPLLALTLHANTQSLLRQKHRNVREFDQMVRYLVDRRNEAHDPQLRATLPGRPPWELEVWRPMGFHYLRKRDQSSDNTSPWDQFPREESEQNPAGRQPNLANRVLERILRGDKTGKSLGNVPLSVGDKKAQSRVLHSPASTRTGEDMLHPSTNKRFWWRVLGGYKMGKRTAPPENRSGIKRPVPEYGSARQNSQEVVPDLVPAVRTESDEAPRGKRVFWRLFRGHLLKQGMPRPGAKLLSQTQHAKKRFDLSKIRKLLKSVNKLFTETPDENTPDDELMWLIKELKNFTLLNSSNYNFEAKITKPRNKRAITSADRDNKSENQTENTVKQFRSKLWGTFEQEKHNAILSDEGTGLEYPGSKEVTKNTGQKVLSDFILRKHRFSLVPGHEDTAADDDLGNGKPRKQSWNSKSGGHKLGNQPVAHPSGLAYADETKDTTTSSLELTSRGSVLADTYKLRKRPLSKVPRHFIQTVENYFSNKNSNLGKRTGFKPAGKLKAGQVVSRGAEHKAESLGQEADVKNRRWSQVQAGGPQSDKRRSPVHQGMKDNVEDKTFQWGTDITQLWQQLTHHNTQPPQPGPPPDQPDNGQNLTAAEPPTISRLGSQKADFWKHLADFLFGDHVDDNPGVLLEFLDPSSFTSAPETKGAGIIEHSPQPNLGGVSVAKVKGYKET